MVFTDKYNYSFDFHWAPNNEETQMIEEKYEYIALDSTSPSLFGGMSLVSGQVPLWCGKFGVAFFTTLRRFFLIILGSCHAVVLMMILDRQFFNETISRLMKFETEYQVPITDIKYWNHFGANHSHQLIITIFPFLINTTQ